jgi:hypothetical protein
MKQTINWKKILPASVVVFVLSISAGYGQLSISMGYGLQIPGRQDLKFRYYENGVLMKNLKTSKAISSWSPVSNLSVTYWHHNIGFDVSYLKWENKSRGVRFLTNEIPPFTKMEQSRSLFLLSFLSKTRNPFLKKGAEDNGSYGYWGVGFGAGITETNPGMFRSVKLAMQLLYGVSFKVTSHVRFFTEAKYLLAHDADNAPPSTFTGWKVDTSGHPFPLRPHPHLDTRFYDLQFGLRFRL